MLLGLFWESMADLHSCLASRIVWSSRDKLQNCRSENWMCSKPYARTSQLLWCCDCVALRLTLEINKPAAQHCWAQTAVDLARFEQYFLPDCEFEGCLKVSQRTCGCPCSWLTMFLLASSLSQEHLYLVKSLAKVDLKKAHRQNAVPLSPGRHCEAINHRWRCAAAVSMFPVD